MKNAVYVTPVDSEMDLGANIICAPADIEENPGRFERVPQSKIRLCKACIPSNDRNFEHLL